MKKIYCLFFFVCIITFLASEARADYQHVDTKDGVEVMVEFNPLGPNNAIVASVKFINNNQYKVEVTWKPLITCDDGSVREGSIGSLGLDGNATSVVNIWRLAACGQREVRDLSADMEVKK